MKEFDKRARLGELAKKLYSVLSTDDFAALLKNSNAETLQGVAPANLDGLLLDLERIEFARANGGNKTLSAILLLQMLENGSILTCDVDRRLSEHIEHAASHYFDICEVAGTMPSGKGAPLKLIKVGEVRSSSIEHLKALDYDIFGD